MLNSYKGVYFFVDLDPYILQRFQVILNTKYSLENCDTHKDAQALSPPESDFIYYFSTIKIVAF